uniref:NADH dehydrogenase subunit 4L n=1 Tax=Spinactaletes boneti TaxID=2736147 RepID=UPI001EE03ABB|nr:NADH dehydrogenase subunit 4L [Spinactaletes boneti]UJY98012.1 NADH dehydrogenase subunit 4L [Spinactaletes boneti]
MLFISFFIFLSGIYLFGSKIEHMLTSLLSLEYMVLGLFMMMYSYFDSSWFLFSLFYLVFTACEGALGLSLMVMCSKTHGGDYFKSFNLIYDNYYFTNNMFGVNFFFL